jgi:hypothetical protein
MATKFNTQTATKPETQQTAKAGPAVVVFGKNEEGKALAARFRSEEAELAIKAAGSMKLRVLKVTTPEIEIVASQLPLGRIYASGLAFVPEVQDAFLTRLQELAEPKPAPGFPKNWDAIEVGHLVLAQEVPTEGWYEAIVVGKDKDMLTVQWRDYIVDHSSSSDGCVVQAKRLSARGGPGDCEPGSFHFSTKISTGSRHGDKS